MMRSASGGTLRDKRYAKRASVILKAEDEVGYPTIDDVAEGAGCLPQMARRWVDRWLVKSRIEVSTEFILRDRRDQANIGRPIKHRFSMSEMQEIVEDHLSKGMERPTARDMCRKLGMDPSSSALHSVRKALTVLNKTI
jgi:hypothetical protein